VRLTEGGVTLIGGGIATMFMGFIGWSVRRRWARLDPGDVALTPAQQFALARQKAIVKQGPWFLRAGVLAVAAGFALLALHVLL